MLPTFQHPWYLLGLPLAAIPVILYLLRRWRLRRVDWAAMDFLFTSAQQSARRTRLRDIILLIVRTLAIAGIVLAVSRPSWQATGDSAGGQPRAIAVVLDNSYSMSYATEQGTPLQHAKALAQDVVRSLRPGDGATLIACSAPATAIIREPASDHQALLSAIERLEPTEQATDIAGSLQAATQSLSAAVGYQREIHLFTDLQRCGWEAVSATDLRSLGEQTPIALTIHDVSVPSVQNLAVTDLRPADRLTAVGFPAWFECTVKSFASEPVSNATVTFSVDGFQRDTKTVAIAPGEEQRLLFAARFEDDQSHFVRASLQPDALPVDDQRFFSLRPRRSIPVLLVDGSATAADKPADSYYLRLALRPEQPLAEASSIFDPSVMPSEALSEQALQAPAVIALADVPRLSDPVVTALEARVRAGAGLLIFVGAKVSPTSYNDLLYREGRGLLPVSMDRVADSSEGEAVRLLANHPALAAFKSSAVLPATARVFRRVRLVMPAQPDDVRVLAETAGGEPLIVEKLFGSGRVILVATSADDAWHALPKTAVFLPMLHELMGYLASREDDGLNLQVGQPLRVTVPAELFRQSLSVRVPGVAEPLFAQVLPRGEEFTATLDETPRGGVYDVELPGVGGQHEVLHYSVNVDAREGDLTKLSLQEARALTGMGGLEIESGRGQSSRLAQAASRFEAGRLALLVVCALLFVEMAATQIR